MARDGLHWVVVLAACCALAAPATGRAMDPPHNPANGIRCRDCHSLRGGFGLVPHDEEQEALCKTCHNPLGMASSMVDVSLHVVDGGTRIVDCGSCHNAHGGRAVFNPRTGVTARPLSLVTPFLAKYVPGALRTSYQTSPDDMAYGELDPPWNGVCQACHTATSHHTQDASADHSHNLGEDCTTCHPHESSFAASGGCVDCHDQPQGARRQIVENAGDGLGDFVLTSHHVTTGAEDADCATCHYTGDHGSGTVKLRDPDAGLFVLYSYDPADPSTIEDFCVNCHDADGAASGGGLTPFTDAQVVPDVKREGGAGWSGSAHAQVGYAPNGGSPLTCLGDGSTTGCHGNGHGSDNIELLAGAVFGADLASACYACHTEGGVANDAISGPDLADDIEQAFSLDNGHDLGTAFHVGANTFTLQCTSCHNPHQATGQYWQADLGKTPVSLPDFSDPVGNPRAMGWDLHGDVAGEKMDDYAAGGLGIYSTPNGDSDVFDGADLPDYVTFCMACHGAMDTLLIDWVNDMHGDRNAGSESLNSGDCPNWYSCGKGTGWDGDDCVDEEDICWPVTPRGRGLPYFTKPGYAWTAEDKGYSPNVRNTGANYVIGCTDCHEAHGGPYGMLRASINGNGNNPNDWNGDDGFCVACHYSWGPAHAGMSCGYASCHVDGDIHGMAANGDVGPNLPEFDRDLVVYLPFEGNLKDAGDWNMHATWRTTSGSFVTGSSGQGISVSDQPLEVGTENEWWSTDEGYHGTWKYTEMKYNMTLEAWVYPTDDTQDERVVMAKHTYWDGGYALVVEKIDGELRAGLMTNMTGGAPDYYAWDSVDCNGLRGAVSSSSLPLNEWTHIAATYDVLGPDRDPADPSAGRVRIWVNGEDVTTSYQDEGTCFAQPKAGEEAMYPYSAHSPGNEAVCYEAHWCGSALSVGGVNWTSPNENFVGVLDDVKIWNITQDATYFEDIDALSPPRVELVSGLVGSSELEVGFSEGVFGAPGSSGSLEVSDLVFNDADNGRTIVGVEHVAGSAFAVVTLGSALDGTDDLFIDSLAAVAGAIYDEYGNAATTTPSVVMSSLACPASPVVFDLDDPPGSLTSMDSQGMLYGVVGGNPFTGTAFVGDGVSTGIEFPYNAGCLQSSRAMTVETVIRPENTGGTDNYIRRVLARDSNDDFQLSVWRNNSYDNFEAPDGVCSIAYWVSLIDNHGGYDWKPVLTDYDACPIVGGHTYHVKATWDSDKVGGMPGDIYVDDMGTDGADAGEAWAGFVNCTDADQSQLTADRQIYEGDEIAVGDGAFGIGRNINNPVNNVFDGTIEWIIWSDSVY